MDYDSSRTDSRETAPEGKASHPPLAIVNHPPSRLPGPELLHKLVRQHGVTGNAAIDFLSRNGNRTMLSYDELHRLSDILAGRITASRQSRNMQPRDGQFVVPILAPQQPDLYVAILAILKAGGAFCPLNLDAPPERVKFILQDVAARVVVTTREFATIFPNDDALAVLVLDDDDAQEAPKRSSSRVPIPSDLAYVMYTSGSTGTPKGVGVPHLSATQSLLAHDRHIPSFFRFLQFAAPTFDVSVFEIFFPLFRGSTLVACSRAEMLNDLPAVLNTMEVDACELTPSVAGSLLRKRENAPRLKLLLTIGEMLTTPVIEEFGGGDDRSSMLWAMYGPTEAAIHCTLQPALVSGASVGNIGIPLNTVSAFILKPHEEPDTDKTLQVLRVGEVGELAVGGYQLANGYLNRPEANTLAFIESPYGPLYRTLDKARILPDGTIECLGRVGSGQVKLRGQRIELGEIEQAALRAKGCHSAVAVVIGSILVLFCAVDRGDMEAEIRASCESWLPGFMVPGDILTFKEFPRLPSGKVNRRQLESEYSVRQKAELDSVPEFRDATEEKLCHIAGDLLGQEIHPSARLAAYGMDSLVAIKFASALRREALDVSTIDVLRSISISQLRALIDGGPGHNLGHYETTATVVDTRALGIDVVRKIPILQPHVQHVEAVLPCTPLQSAMLAETASNPRAYCNWLELSCPADKDIINIRSWIMEISERNDILRTGFALHDGQFVQVVWKDSSPMSVLEVRGFDRDFTISTEAEFLHPLKVQFCSDKDECRLLLQIHHAIYDGWTLDLLLADMDTLLRGGELPSHPRFREVVDYTHSAAFSQQCDTARIFWAESLAGFQAVPFPQMLSAVPKQRRVVSQVTSFHLSPRSVKESLQEIECGSQVLFQAALTWLWSSVIGEEDTVIGSVTSGRTIPVAGIENVMGPCISTLPIRTNVSQTRTIKDLLGTIQASNRTAVYHGFLPLAEIKRSAGVLPGQPLYDVLFVYQESLHSTSTHDIAVKEIAHFDYLETKILVEVEPKKDYFDLRLTYHTYAFSEAQATLFSDELQHVARHMFHNLSSELASLNMIFPDPLLSSHNLNPKSYSGVQDLAAAVEKVVARSPDKTAIRFAGQIIESSTFTESVSYKQLNSLGNKIARYIKSRGCSTGDVVGIIMEKSVLLYAGILGIVKARCSYLPLLPDMPPARIEAILAQANATTCLTDSSTLSKLSPLSTHQFISLDKGAFEALDDTNLRLQADLSRIANIIYTSGSTGVPKGVCVTELNITSNLDVLSRIYPVRDDSALLQSCSQAFDVSVFEIFFAWTQGICLCSATNDVLFEDLESSIRELQVTHLSMTPTVASLINPKNVPKVEFLVTSGEPMSDKVAKTWWRQLYQGYGPSETTNICTVKKMGPDDVVQHLGWSLDNTSTVILYRDGVTAVPRGCVGELCFGGDQVAQGYLNMPDLTTSKFISHPKFGRLYRSGDLGRMLPDGSLVIMGRADDQIKLRGQRIELNEINETIRQLHTGSDAVTMLVKRGASSPVQLASFCVFRESANTRTAEVIPFDDHIRDCTASLNQLLIATLPTYMVPAYYIPVSKIPLTASGKRDMAWFGAAFDKLGQSYLELAASKAEMHPHDSQWSETEQAIANIVSSVLPMEGKSAGRWTPLVSFGLDSISAISLGRKLQQHFGQRVPVSSILQNPSVARLAQALCGQKSGLYEDQDAMKLDIFTTEWVEGVKSKARRQGKKIQKILPCTPLQEAMLAASANGKAYLNSMLFRLYGDAATMRRHWAVMCERHGILRTCFVSTDDLRHPFAQAVLDDWQPEWLDLDERHGNLDNCIAQHSANRAEAIDSLEPPVSFAIIRQQTQVYLSFICHHALYDGIAIGQLLLEVEQLADGTLLKPPPPIEPFLRVALSMSQDSNNFWKKQLLDCQPTLFPAVNGGSHKTRDVFSTRVDISLSKIYGRTKEMGCTLLSLCQAVWASVLAVMFQVDDICFGNVVSCRSLAVEGIESLVVPCFNTVPIRMDLSNTRRIIDLIKDFNTLNTQVIKYGQASLRRIQSLASTGHNQRLFDTLLLLQHPTRSLNHKIWSLERDEGEMDLPLVCEIIPSIQEDTLLVRFHYESSSITNRLIELTSALLGYCMSNALSFPYSHVPTPSTIPKTIGNLLSGLDLRKNIPSPQETARPRVMEDWSDLELRIRAVLAELSSASEHRIRRDTTIYQLGLDSINAVQLASLFRQNGIIISASEIIQQKTCANIATKALSTSPDSDPPPWLDFTQFQQRTIAQLSQYDISQDSVESILPCTPLQTGLILQFLQSRGRDYFNFIGFQLDNEVEVDVLSNAWVVVSQSHAMLRTGFVPVEDKDFTFAMVQYAPSSLRVPISVLDSKNHMGWSVEKWRLDTANEILDDINNPPWRVLFISSGSGLMMHLGIHHALYDAQSLQRLLENLARVLAGKPLVSAPPSDNVVRDIIGQVSQADTREKFWKGLRDDVVVNQFPILTPLRVDLRETIVESIISGHRFSHIETVLKASAFTIQAALFAAWTRILSAYLGETSVTFGVVLSGRNTEATKDACFPCISTLPVISSNNTSNKRLLQSMLEYNTQLYNHQHVPLTKTQRWLGYPDSRVFDTLLVYQKPSTGLGRPSPPWEVLDDQGTADYPVSIEIEPSSDDRLIFRITFSSHIIPREHSILLLQQFDAVLSNLVLHPDGQETDLVQLSPHLLSVTPAEEPKLYCPEKYLHQFVETQAHTAPHKTALQFVSGFHGDYLEGQTWSYRELDENGNRVARLLKSHVQKGSIVAIHFEKCPEAFFSILGILKAGCAFVALDVTAPASRNLLILEDSRASLLLTSPTKKIDLGFSVNLQVLAVDKTSLSAIDAEPVHLDLELTPQDTCYCLYTSGTTGRPKGCEITHENAVQAMLAFQRLFSGHWDGSSRWLQFASFHFDVAMLEQYWSWSVGITVVSCPRDLILADLAGTISRLEITHIDLTPSLARLLHPDDVPSLTKGVFITGGEQLKQEILDVWGPKAVIYNAYGPTEATIGVTTYPRVPRNGRSSNIGKQFVNVGSYVLKPGTETPVLRGGVGELCVSGKLVGKGYLNRDDLTMEKFPTLQQFNEKVYRTGDLVRILHDGCFDFLGRADDQVKLRGQRLELGEINHTIRTSLSEGADVATLVIRNDEQQKDFLVSFVVLKDHHKPYDRLQVLEGRAASELSKQVQDVCREKLPGYMVPTYVLTLPFIPLSSNNKLEVRKLRELFNEMNQEQLISLTKLFPASAIGLSDTEQKIFDVLASLESLGTAEVDSNTSIFELGIDSISIIRFAGALKREGLSQASPALIMKYPRLGDMARKISAQCPSSVEEDTRVARQLVHACSHRYRAHVQKVLRADQKSIEYIAPCSPLQEGMISRSKAPAGAYFNTFKYELLSTVSALKLQKAWSKVSEACSILRTRFISTADGYIQVAMMPSPLPWREVHLSEGTDLGAFLRTDHQLWKEKHKNNIEHPLDLLLLHIGNRRRILVLNIFHGLYDGISLELLMLRVQNEYLDLAENNSKSSFLDALIHGPLKGYAASKEFWCKHLELASHQLCPVISPRPTTEDIKCRRQVKVENLEGLRASLGVTHQAVIQAVWISVIRQFFASVTVGIVVSGRSIDLDGADQVIGPLFNTVAFHAHFDPDESWTSLIGKCHDFLVTILPFQHVPLRNVQKWCSSNPGAPLFDTLFSFQRATKQSVKERLWTVIESPLNADFPLAFEATLTHDSFLDMELVAQAGYADHNALSRLLDEVEAALESVLAAKRPLKGRICPQDNGNVTSKGAEQGAAPSPVANSFVWTETALVIRNEVALLAEVPVEVVGPTTSLFELGLDSIDLIKLSSRLRQRGVSLSNTQLMKDQDVPTMVRQIQQQPPKMTIVPSDTSTVTSMSTVLNDYLFSLGYNLDEIEDVIPVTPLQDSIVAEMIHSDFHRYFNHDVLELDIGVELDRLQRAWNEVASHSPVLRTTFLEVDIPNFDAAYCQIVNKTRHLCLEEVMMSDEMDLPQVMDTARRRACHAGGRSSLLQLAVVNANNSRYLVISVAHALYDGWSIGMLHRDVRAAYHGSYTPRPPYKKHLDRILGSSTFEAELFWTGFLAGAPPTLIPEREFINESDQEETHRIQVTSTVPCQEIKTFCRRQAISVHILGQACWAAVLACRAKSLDVTYGVVISGRDSAEAEHLMFPTMNTVAIRSVLHGNVSSWLRYMQENMTNIMIYQHFPLRNAQKLVEGSRGPLFNSLYIQQRAHSLVSTDRDPWMTSVGGSSATEYPVCIEGMISDELDAFSWTAACSSRHFSRKETVTLVHQLDAVFRYLVGLTPVDVFNFSGGAVSVCGLPSFHMPDGGEAERNATKSLILEDKLSTEQWSDTETCIRSALSEVSGVPVASIQRYFSVYHVGLDSISTIKVVSLLRKDGVSLPARQMLGAKSISEMAALSRLIAKESRTATQVSAMNGTRKIGGLGEDAFEDDMAQSLGFDVQTLLTDAEVDISGVEEVLPATAMQVHMLSVWQNTSGTIFYPEFSYSLRGDFNINAIRDAWVALVKRNCMLRTAFVASKSRQVPFLQVIQRHRPELVEVLLGNGALKSQVVDRSSSPFVSFRAIRLDRHHWQVKLKLHHALYDAISLPMILESFLHLCQGDLRKGQNGSHGLWKRFLSFQVSEEVRYSRQVFWKGYLRDAKSVTFRSRASSASPLPRKTRTSFLQRSAIRDDSRLRSISSASGFTLQTLFYAAYSKVLASNSGLLEDIVFGIYLANRTSADGGDPLPYPTLSLVPVCIRRPARLDVLTIAKAIQDDLYRITSQANASAGLWEIYDWTGIKINSFVNFLTTSTADKCYVKGNVSMEELTQDRASETQDQDIASEGYFKSSNIVREAYADAVDIEVSTAAGSMDIGVFGSSDIVDVAGAKDLVSAMVKILVHVQDAAMR